MFPAAALRIALLLAGAGVVAAPRKAYPWVLVALAGMVLAMGTVLWRDGAVVVPHVVLPLTWLNRSLAFLAEPLNFPVRFLALPMVSLCVLGALAASRWRWRRCRTRSRRSAPTPTRPTAPQRSDG
jgi:hypothetical protein